MCYYTYPKKFYTGCGHAYDIRMLDTIDDYDLDKPCNAFLEDDRALLLCYDVLTPVYHRIEGLCDICSVGSCGGPRQALARHNQSNLSVNMAANNIGRGQSSSMARQEVYNTAERQPPQGPDHCHLSRPDDKLRLHQYMEAMNAAQFRAWLRSRGLIPPQERENKSGPFAHMIPRDRSSTAPQTQNDSIGIGGSMVRHLEKDFLPKKDT